MNKNQVKVLIVEDNEGDARLITEILKDVKNISYDCAHARSLKIAFELTSQQEFDIVLLDFHLPDSQGIETFKQAHEKMDKLPIVVMTGLDNDEVALDVMSQGAQDYLIKGLYDESTLSRVIRYAIERNRIDLALKESEERYEIAVEGSNSGLWDWNLNKGEIYYSPSWKKLMGYAEDEVTSRIEEWFERIHPEDKEAFERNMERHIQGETEFFKCEYRILHKDKSTRWALVQGKCLRNGDGKATRIAGSQTDITARKKAEQRLIYNAFHDDLTGLPSRSLFATELKRAFTRRERHTEENFAVIYLDLDRFKIVNDSMGHVLGDELLISAAKRLQSCVRKVDLVARIGGDEFAILFDPALNRDQAAEIAERIKNAFEKPFFLDGQKVFVSTSIGIAMSEFEFEGPDEMIRDADTAMYEAKRNGGKGYRFFDRSMHREVVLRMRSENELQNAIYERQFVLFYQPIIDLRTGKVVGVESLIRWKHPGQGMIYPLDFIPLAEETGLILPIGEWVVKEACSQIQLINKQLSKPENLFISANISFKQLLQSDFVGGIEKTLKETGLQSNLLGLEVTESGFMENPEYFMELITRIRALGIELHMDDFGTGYSSLSYLHRFKFDKLKIDRDFMLDHGNGDRNIKILKSIIELCNDLEIATVSEGVEDAETLQFLRELKCQYAQGYYFSKPLPFNELMDLLKKNPTW